MNARGPVDRAILCALVSALLFGASTPLARALVTDTHPLWLAGLLYLGSGVGLSAYLLARRRGERREALITRGDVGWLAAAIVSGGVAAPLLFAFGLRMTSGAAASLLLNLETVFTVALAWFVFREHRSRSVVIGMLSIVAGSALLGWQGAPSATDRQGAALLAAACLLWAIDNNLTRKVAGSDATVIAAAKGLFGGATNCAAAALVAGAAPPAIDAAMIAAVGLAGYGVSLVLFVLSLRGLGVARASAYFGISPFIGAGVAYFALGERPPALLWLAAAMMLAGIWLHLRERHLHEHHHDALVHSHPHRHDEHHRHGHDFDWDGREPHVHEHVHEPLTHDHAHYPDLHHRHEH
jgi:drug/metabolite transporter (DMT)-like permease